MWLKIGLVSVIFAMGIGVFFLSSFAPVSGALRACYDWSEEEIKTDKIDADAYGWSSRKICAEDAETLKSLDFCVIKVGIDFDRSEKSMKKVFNVTKAMKPGLKSINQLKEAHNRTCIEYSKTLLKIRR